MLLPTWCLLRRADTAAVIGAALVAKATGAGFRPAAKAVGRPAGTVRGWLRRIDTVADGVRSALLGVAAQLGVEFTAPGPAGSNTADVVALVGALAAAAVRRLGPCDPWRLAAAATAGRLLAPSGPPVPGVDPNTSCLFAGSM